MKQFKGSFILKALTALVLALLLMFSTVATSFAAVVDDLADSGAEVDLAESGANTVYFINKDGWSTVNAYSWDPSEVAGWPGENMTNVYGRVYSYNKANNKIIFNNGSGSQTSDADVSNGKIYANGTWYDYSVENFTFYVANTANWTDVYAYTFSGEGDYAWPGTKVISGGNANSTNNFSVTKLSDGVLRLPSSPAR